MAAGLESLKSLYGVEDPQLQEYLTLLKENETALKARYENPNWFNVAAGFLKPQLGGFAASLGSASASLGDTLEKQRANELDVAKMRSEIGMTKMVLSQRQKAAQNLQRGVEAAGPPGSPQAIAAETSAFKDESPVVAGLGVVGKAQAENIVALNATNARITAQKAAGITVDPKLIAEQNRLQQLVQGAATTAVPGAAVPGAIVPGAVPEAVLGAPPPATPNAFKVDKSEREKIDIATGRSSHTGFIPMAVKLPENEYLSDKAREAKQKEADAETATYQPQYTQLSKIVNTPNFGSVRDSFNIIKGFDPDDVEEVTDLVRKQGGWAALLAKGVGASLTASTNPASAGLGLNAHAAIQDYLVANKPPRLRAVYDALYNNLGAIEEARKAGMVPGSLGAGGNLQQTGKALWHSIAKDAVLLDQAQTLYNTATGLLENHTNQRSMAPVADVFKSKPIREIYNIYDEEFKRLTARLHKRPAKP
jgi:hypothetical protein